MKKVKQLPYYALIEKIVVKVVGYRVRKQGITISAELAEDPGRKYELEEKHLTEIPENQNIMKVLYDKSRASSK